MFINTSLNAERQWDDAPGGTVVREWEEDGQRYVAVVFKKSPGIEYIYYA